MVQNYRIASLIDYIKVIQDIYRNEKPKKHLFFRGHSKVSYKLIPSVFRENYSEKDILLDFKQYAPEHHLEYDFIYDCDKVLGDMQHYGLPTRLLDWSISPLVGLYFACRKSNNGDDEDGCVFIFNPWSYNSKIVKNYGIPEIHQIHIISRALLAYRWNIEDIIKYLQKRFINVDLTEEDILKPISFVSPYTNKRKVYQRGCFTIHGRDHVNLDFWDEAQESIKYITINQSDKANIQNELNILYVNEYSIYPDFDGMSEMIKKYGSLFNYK